MKNGRRIRYMENRRRAWTTAVDNVAYQSSLAPAEEEFPLYGSLQWLREVYGIGNCVQRITLQ